MYAHVPAVTTYPVYLGDLDKVLAPFVDGRDRRAPRPLAAPILDRPRPDAARRVRAHRHRPGDSRIARSILRVERSLRQVVPNITLKVDPAVTPDDLLLDAVRTVFETGKPHFVNHPMMVADHGEQYAAVSCYNSLKIGGGAHTLVRLNLKEVVAAPQRRRRRLPRRDAAHYVELTAELAEARIRSLVEDQRFFETHWLAREGLVSLDRFSAMFGMFGLAEAVNLLIAYEGGTGRYGHDADADALSYRITAARRRAGGRPTDAVLRGRRRPLLPALPERHRPRQRRHRRHTHPGGRRARRCSSTSRPAHRTIACSRPASATSSTSTRPRCATRRPSSTSSAAPSPQGMRDFTFNLDSNEFIRITGYLVRKSDLVDIDVRGARHASDYLAAGSEAAYHLTQRAVKRIGCHERDPCGLDR